MTTADLTIYDIEGYVELTVEIELTDTEALTIGALVKDALTRPVGERP